MRKPLNCKSWNLASTVLIGLVLTPSIMGTTDIDEVQSCDNEFHCGSERSPFSVGQQYFYTFQLESMVSINQWANVEDHINKTVAVNGSLMITPLSSCEILISLNKIDDKQSETILKVAFENGNIRRTCSSSKDPTDPDTNILRAVSSLLQAGNFETSTDTEAYPEKLDYDTVLEDNSQGTCLTKYKQLGPNKFLKYKSMKFCGSPGSLLQNIKLKASHLSSLIDAAQVNENLEMPSESPNSDNVVRYVNGLSICEVIKDDVGVISSSYCKEEQGTLNKVYLKLEEIKQNGTPPTGLIFFMAGLTQQGGNFVIPSYDQDDTCSDIFITELRAAVKSLSNSTIRSKLNTVDVINGFNKLKSLFGPNTKRETLQSYLQEVLTIDNKEEILLIMKVAAGEASNNVATLEFLQNTLSNDLVKQKLTETERELIVIKTIRSITSLTYVTVEILKGSKFLIDYANENRFSLDVKSSALSTFSQHLNQFCTRMRHMTQDNFCKKNEQIQKWIESLILNEIKNHRRFYKKFESLEAFANVHEHTNASCQSLVDLGNDNTQNLWTILSCYRHDFWSQEAKTFYRSLLEDVSKFSNIRIAAFLAIMECPQKDDLNLMKTVIQNEHPKNHEIVTFITTYMENRVSKGLIESEPFVKTDRNSLGIADTPAEKVKFTRASNTLIEIPISSHMKVLLETNILYFEKLAMIPQLISGKVLLVETYDNSTFAVENNNLIQLDIFVDDDRNSEQLLNFRITVVARIMGKPLFKKNFPLSEEALLRLLQILHQKARQSDAIDNGIGWLIRQKLLKLYTDPITIDLFELGSLANRYTYLPTISGMQSRSSFKLDGFMRLSIEKDNCSDLITTQGESQCRFLKLNTDFNYGLSIYAATGLGTLEQGYLAQSNISGAIPLFINGLRTKNDEGLMQNIVKLTLPSNILHLVGGHGHEIQAVEVEEHEIVSSQLLSRMKMGKVGLLESIDVAAKTTMDVELRITEASDFTIKANHPSFEAVFLANRYPTCLIVGNYTSLRNPTHPITVGVKVAVNNANDNKKLEVKLTKGEEEYSMDAYYVKKTFNKPPDSGSYGCNREQGLLCSWPFCILCNTEYFVGATVSTPHFKDIKLFEGSVTQEFPRRKLEVIAKTAGVPLIKNAEFKLTLNHGNNTVMFESSRLREVIDKKLSQLLPTQQQETSGDALSESESLAATSIISGYSMDTELNTDLLGNSALSLVYISVYENQDLHRVKTTIFGGGVFYPLRNQEEQLTVFSTTHRPDITGTNITSDSVTEGYLRSTQFPIINADLIAHQQKSLNLIKKMITLKPFNIIKGDIRLETIDKAGNENNFMQLFKFDDPSNLHIDRTYKMFLPRHIPYHIFKGKIVVKKSDGTLKEAAIEALMGFDHAFEVKYEVKPEEHGNSYKFLTSVIANGETYGLHHDIETMPESVENDMDGNLLTIADDEQSLEKRKYRGTYILGELSMKASGIFLSRKGNEILPFSKFGIQTTSVDGKNDGPKISGHETLNDDIHNMEISIRKGDDNILEFKNEINPSSQVPIKASVSVKDYVDVKIHDTSKYTNARNLQVKAQWIPDNKIAVGKISFPSRFDEPPYIDVAVSVAKEADIDNPLFKFTSSSSFEFGKNSSVSTENVIQIHQSKWEAGLNGFFINENSGFPSYMDNKNFSLQAFYALPDLKKYSGKVAMHHFYSFIKSGFETWEKVYLNLQRPDITPLQLHLEFRNENFLYRDDNTLDSDTIPSTVNTTKTETYWGIVQFCHKDNFLTLFPLLNTDFHIEGFRESTIEQIKMESDGSSKGVIAGKGGCNSKGIYIPFCNDVKSSYRADYEWTSNGNSPWWMNITTERTQPGLIDELTMKITATYEPVKSTYASFNIFDQDIFEMGLSTVRGDTVLKNNYNIEYDIQRKQGDNNEVISGINGTYACTRTYESLNFFEFSDHMRWSQMDGEKLHIWTNLLNHSTDSNLTGGSATFSSQYVSLGEDSEGGGCGDSCNITWMELRSMVSSNGFGTLQTTLLNPSKVLEASEGEIEADFLIRTEFSPLKTFRVLFSHDISKSESEEDSDSDSVKFGALTKVNGILNEIEISGTNSLTLATGKLVGVGETLIGRYRSPSGVYEYFTINAFAVAPTSPSQVEGDNVLHFDVSSSWTNADDDDTDLRVVSDVVYSLPFQDIPIFRFAYFKNSTDLDIEKNGSILIYRSSNSNRSGQELRLPENIISDGMDELSFTQPSLQSIYQQIIDDYWNATGYNSGSNSDAYIFNAKSRSVLQNAVSSTDIWVKLMGFKEQLYYCQSSLQTCSEDNEEHHVDISNYCNLFFIPIKLVLYLVSYFGF